MEKRIVIITATYNHGNLLSKLYTSLKKQTNKHFRWIIINDGSTDTTEDVVSAFLNQNEIEIQYIVKCNTGKSDSLNKAFEGIRFNEIAVIVDDDENLDENAIKIVEQYYVKYYRTKVGSIHFHRRDITSNKIIANYTSEDDLVMDYRQFKSSGRNADGYVAYFGYALEKYHFPIYKGEKYVAPSILIMLCGDTYQTVWAKESIGTTEYVDGGITKQGRKLRVKNPVSMILYCTMFQKSISSYKIRCKYSIMGYAYQHISGKSKKKLNMLGISTDCFVWYVKPFGLVLGVYWSKKYLR